MARDECLCGSSVVPGRANRGAAQDRQGHRRRGQDPPRVQARRGGLALGSGEGGTGKELSLPLGWKILWYADELLFATPDLRTSAGVSDYQYPLTIPGRVEVHECRFTIEARRISGDEVARYNPDELLDADSVTGPLVVRNWRAGDRFWPAHTKSPKKIKELVQERHVAQPERGRWPVIVHDDEIIWMRGFPVPAKYKSQPGKTAVAVLETLSNS